MISILIKGMEMPKNGWKHIMLTSDGKAYRFEEFTAGETATRYEAVEVPPHGNLIDADELKTKYFCGENVEHDKIRVTVDNVLHFIDNAPTVIPADAENMSEPTCYGCKYLADTFGNYVECKKTAETGTHMFVDWYYWNDGCPDDCPLKAKDGET